MDYSDFDLSIEQLTEISEKFRFETELGLKFNNSLFRCIPAFVDTRSVCRG